MHLDLRRLARLPNVAWRASRGRTCVFRAAARAQGQGHVGSILPGRRHLPHALRGALRPEDARPGRGHMRASEEGAAAAAPAPGSGTPTHRRVSRPGRLRVVYSCAALDTVDGEASGLECALRRLGVTDDGSARGPAGGTGKQQPAFGRAVLPSPGASSSGGSGDSAWDVLSNCSSCGSPRMRTCSLACRATASPTCSGRYPG